MRHSPLSFSVETFDINIAREEVVAIVFIFVFLDDSRTFIWKFIGSKPTNHLSLSAWYIADMMTVFRHYLNGVRIVFIIGFWHQGTVDATDISTNAFTVVYTSNLQDTQVVVDAQPTAIVALFRQWAMISF